MSLITIEGFETRASKTGWSSVGLDPGRFGGYAAGDAASTYSLPAPIDEFVVGFALRVSSTATFFRTYSLAGIDPQIRVALNNSKGLTLYRKDTVLQTSDIPIADPNQWVFIEIIGKVAEVGGYCQVRVNGVIVIDYVGDTQDTAGDTRLYSMHFPSGNGNSIDDVYICDRTGSDFNNFLGEIQVVTLSPNGNGVFSQLVGSDGNSVDNWMLVDELPAVDTDHVGSALVGQRDTYTFANPTIPGQYLAVQSSAQISKTVAGDASVRLIQRLANGAEHKSPAFVASNIRWVADTPRTRDPENGVWTLGSISSAEFGVEVA